MRVAEPKSMQFAYLTALIPGTIWAEKESPVERACIGAHIARLVRFAKGLVSYTMNDYLLHRHRVSKGDCHVPVLRILNGFTCSVPGQIECCAAVSLFYIMNSAVYR